MQVNHEFLANLALVLCVAGITTFIFQRLRLPVVFGYLLAGLIMGPHTRVPLLVDAEITHTLAELGVIMLMFSLGLEFTLRKLIRIGPTAGIIGVVETTGMVWLGFMIGRSLGWTSLESIYAGAIIAISSTTIIMKAFAEQGIRTRYSRLVFAIVIVEDLIAIFILTLLTALSAGQGVSAATIGSTAFDLVLFLGALIGVGILVVPRLVKVVVRLNQPETTLVTSVGICFACALLALEFGYSVALGAFIAGSLIAESGHGKTIEHLVQPVTNMFGAIFFVSVGTLIDLQLITEHIGAVLLLTAAVIAGKIVFVTLASFATGEGVRTSVQSGMSLAQIGEFSFIIASLGVTLQATRNFLYPVAVAVSALTTLSTPLFIKHSGLAASWLDRKLPRPLQTYVALYGSWIERMRTRREARAQSRLRRNVVLLFADCVLLLTIVIGTAIKMGVFSRAIADAFNLQPAVARWVVIGIASTIAAPLIYGVIQIARALAHELAIRAFPEEQPNRVDLAIAPRRAFEVTLHLLLVLTIGGLLVVVTQPFLPDYRGSLVFAVVLLLMGFALWRSATNLHGHTRAGAEIIAMALGHRAVDEEPETSQADVAKIRESLPGLGEPVPMMIPPRSPLVGRTLRQIDLRGTTGATVLAVVHPDGRETMLPDGKEQLAAGDVLFLAGTHRAVKLAQRLVTPLPEAPVAPSQDE